MPDINFKTFYNVIAGQPRGSNTVRQGVSPIDQAKLWDFPAANQTDVDEAVSDARKALLGWSSKQYGERTAMLEAFADLYLSHASGFVQLLAAETGRPIQGAAVEVHWAANWLRYPSRYEITDESFEDDEKTVVKSYEPLGVVAAICPWNFPLMLAIGKMAPALATGNCVIVKPSPMTPYSTLKLVELAQRVFPPSVVQALGGGDDLGPLLVAHPGIQKISFTGSTETGKKVMRDSAETMKRLTLEMGGNNASIVFPDVDVANVVPRIAAGLWFNAGQVCEALTAVTNALAGDLVFQVGPIQNALQFETLRDLLADCKAHGHTILAGTAASDSKSGQGYFLHPAVIDNPPPDSRIVAEEQFGPIIPCIPFSSTDEVVALANDTLSGLGAAVWTDDVVLAKEVARKLDVGNVFVNGGPKPDPFVPFGGHKMSGLGVEYGREGLLSFCQIKSMYFYK